MTVYIYGLRCPLSREIRYIGKSVDPRRRYRAHLGCRSPKHPKDKWIKSLLQKGMQPDLVILRTLPDDADWAQVEKDEIALGFASGWRLFNLTLGGEGACLSDEHRKRKTQRMRDPETRRKLSESAKARWADPAKREAAIRANRDPKKRARLSEAAKHRATAEYRAMMAEKTKAAWANEATRAKIMSGITDDVKQKVSRASRRFWAQSPNAAICRSNLQKPTPEILKLAADARRKPAHRAKMRRIWGDPEYRQKLSQALKESWAKRRKEA